MTDISLETVAGKLNRIGYDAFLQSLRHAKQEGNRHVELSHWMFHVIGQGRSDVVMTLDHFDCDRGRIGKDLADVINGMKKNVTEMPGMSPQIIDLLDRGWHYATLLFGESQIRTGHALVAILKNDSLRRELLSLSKEFEKINVDQLASESRQIWKESDEETLRPMDGKGLASGDAPAGDAGPRGDTPLARFAKDMTAIARSGTTDPIVGRDEEIRQITDILLRRRQNNPILTGEAGVGKTAVVEGFAQALARGDVPPKLQGVQLWELDIGLMQAGASMKGEFEQRLRSVIDEVQNSPEPIVLFIDEIHTLVGAGGAAGTGDAANLLKPALARGTLRTIGATTWSEYRQYIEKDPALTRRFQPVNVDEPDVARCCYMLRGILGPMEDHHGVRISDEAIVAAVALSHRYIPSRQLPDKAVSLLDTACARVAISQSTTPGKIGDLKEKIDSLTREIAAKQAQRDLGEENEARVAEAGEEKAAAEEHLAELEAIYESEKSIVDEINELRESLGQEGADTDTIRGQLGEKVTTLDSGDAENRMVYSHVDENAVASVISDWTGIPAAKMATDELKAIMNLSESLKERVIGQDHGLEMISKRIETSRAKLANPNKPIGVFMLCGPSGVGKTETALALADAIYGGEQNVITINMSEFQEAHTVSLLKGAPPGYVGYGEGGRLTEAVRRKPYSVVLLDEVEKAHSDVHELFFQVFDKGIMEDGSGRMIDFKNTLILLTSNVGTDVIMDMADSGNTRPQVDELSEALNPFLTQVFPPALLGRIVTIPYFPLSKDVLAGITRLKLNSIVRRVRENHGAVMSYTDAVLDHIVEQCNNPDSGGRMVDNIISNSILPEMSRAVLSRMVDGVEMASIEIGLKDDGAFDYKIA